jgi:Cd2+/Zn2+-exporting ATPase
MSELMGVEKNKKNQDKENENTNNRNLEQFELEGLNCSNCALKIENEIKNIEGLDEVKLNFATSTLNLSGDKNRLEEIEKELQKISDRIEPGVKVKRKNKEKEKQNTEELSILDYIYSKKELLIGTTLFITALLFSELRFFKNSVFENMSIPLYISSYLLIGWPVLTAALKNIGKAQIFDENFLMVIATLGAFGIREYPEAVAVMLFYMVGEMFQDKAVDDSRRSIKSLMDIQAEYANLIKDDKIMRVSPAVLNIGDLIAVKAGEKIPVDGKVKKGSSSLETSALTGESMPREVESGDQVLSGMVNLNKLLTIEVTEKYQDSAVSKILNLVENASSKKAPTEKFITKFSRYYTPFVVFTALLVAVLPPVFTGASFNTWFYRSLIFLVVSCPCALVVSIPLGFFGGIGLASKNGILVKGGNYLEALNSVDTVVFDKTGTLTKGSFEVIKIVPAEDMSREKLLETAAAVEQFSNHPIAESIIQAAGNFKDYSADSKYEEISGSGIKAFFGGSKYLAGNERLMKNNNIEYEKVKEAGTVVYLARNNNYLGYILINDVLKEDAAKTVSLLKEMNIKNIAMLTGDNQSAAENISRELGLDNYYAELLPDQKVEKVESLLNDSSKLAFVGDGINDAPVLARSDLGIAMGGLGSDAAIEAADIVLMTDEPSKIVSALEIARKTKNIVWQNITMALGIKALVMGLSIFGMASMWAAVFADVGVALMAVFNVMRILKS